MPARCPRCGKVISAVLGYCVECKGSGGPRPITERDKRRLSRVPFDQDPRRSSEPYRPRTFVRDETPGYKTVMRYVGAALFFLLGVLVLLMAVGLIFFSSIIDYRNLILLSGIFLLLASVNTFFAGVSALLGVNKWHVVMASGVLLVIGGLLLWGGVLGGEIWQGLLFFILTISGMFMVLEGWPMKTSFPGIIRRVRHGSPRTR
jgi:hypothetical protein